MNISILTTSHDPLDDRIFYHMARSFSDYGWSVEIVSSKIDLIEAREGIRLNCFNGNELPKREKINILSEKLFEFSPEIILCSEPLAIVAARKYLAESHNKTSIIYDITEWYPSKKNTENIKVLFKWFVFIKLLLFNIFSSSLADAFIFGEWYKSRPYRIMFPWKPFIFIPYYPDKKYFSPLTPGIQPNKVRLSYSGRICKDKGFGNFINVLKEVSVSHKDYKIEVKIIGWYETKKDLAECERAIRSTGENIFFSFYEKQPLHNFIDLIKDTDIFLDLRVNDFENSRCLPIKIFYYAALGRPVIFSNLKAISREVEINNFGFLVNPEDKTEIVRIISNYLIDNDIYLKHCEEARKLFETKYNWSIIKPRLLNYIDEISPS